jgi:hypothetical protein
MIENRRVRRQSGDGELGYVTLERAVIQQVPRNIVEPKALTKIME